MIEGDRVADDSPLSLLEQDYDALFCDVWGVLIDGLRCFPQAAQALRRFRAGGKKVVLITNASRPDAVVRRQLLALGAPRDAFDDLVSAGELTLRAMRARRGQRCFHLGPPRDDGLFEAAEASGGAPPRVASPDDADYVVCTGLVEERREQPSDYDPLLARMLRRGLPMLCANPDIVVEVGGTRLWCAGSLAERYAAMGGAVEQFGKPHRAIYDEAQARLVALGGAAVARERILAIGDGARTDLAGAGRAGLDCLFVTDGIERARLRPVGEALDPIALERLIAEAGARPVALTRNIVW